MTFIDLIFRTRMYTRDTNSYVFTENEIKTFINEAIDYLRQYQAFRGMRYLVNNTDEPIILPDYYHYILALYAASRCFDKDERFYEGTEKRNEFESKFDDLLADLHAGNIKLEYIDENDEVVEVIDETNCTDQIQDVYFTPTQTDEEVIEEDEE